LLRPRSVNFRQHFRNLSRKTVPLIMFLITRLNTAMYYFRKLPLSFHDL
jgi:hypothetical protein